MPETPRLVSDVMTLTVVAVRRDAPFKEIVRIMEQWKVSALPVLEGERRVVGVVSEADLLAKEAFRDSASGSNGLVKARAVTAKELMSAPAITVHAGATLAQAARSWPCATSSGCPWSITTACCGASSAAAIY
jgi:CBS-domain-containing membrane protein